MNPPDVVTALMPLPRHYNPDARGNRKPVEDWKFVLTAEEIAEAFEEGGTLHCPQAGSLRGFWWDRGFVGSDVQVLLEVDFPDTQRNREWLEKYAKDVLLERFRQKAIYIKFVGPVERTLVTLEEVTAAEDEISSANSAVLYLVVKKVFTRIMSWLERKKLRRR